MLMLNRLIIFESKLLKTEVVTGNYYTLVVITLPKTLYKHSSSQRAILTP